MRLLRILGLWFGLAVTVGNTIGGGILRTPGSIAQLLPHETFFVGIWLIGALYALLGANALSELGTMLPRSGGQFIFARHAFGDWTRGRRSHVLELGRPQGSQRSPHPTIAGAVGEGLVKGQGQ